MKRIFIILFLCIGILATTNAQKNKVTQAAEKAFAQKFPTAKEVKWEMESKDDYEASFVMDGKKGSANFSGKGDWMETEMGIPQANTPKAVMDGFNKAFAGATIKEVYKIESKEGKNYFEIEYSLKGKTKEAKLDPTGKKM
jgi:outer membrane lipoprotein-sorting protein